MILVGGKMKEQIDDLIVDLIVIKEFSKDIHYTCHGDAFYSKHLLVDKFDWDEHIDLLKECCLLGNGERPLSSYEYLTNAVNRVPRPNEADDKSNFKILGEKVNNALDKISQFKDIHKADENVIGNVAQDLQQYLGLINLQVL